MIPDEQDDSVDRFWATVAVLASLFGVGLMLMGPVLDALS